MIDGVLAKLMGNDRLLSDVSVERYQISAICFQDYVRNRRSVLLRRADMASFPRERESNLVLHAIEEIASEFPRSLYQRVESSLMNLAALSDGYGSQVTLYPWLVPAFYSQNEEQMHFIVSVLREEGLIETDRRTSKLVRLSAKGWSRAEGLSPLKSRQAFVAMWFDDAMQGFYQEGIRPAIEMADYLPIRIDLKEHNNKICDEIIAEIRRSRFLVADFTGNRGGVYFEAGFALGLGLPVIWTCKADSLHDLHFDTRQYNYVLYETAGDLRVSLENRIKATIV